MSRRRLGQPTVSETPDCSYSLASYQRSRSALLAFVGRAERDRGVPVFSFDSILCGDGTCRPELDDVPVYIDDIHFTRSGARKVGEMLDLAKRLEAIAK